MLRLLTQKMAKLYLDLLNTVGMVLRFIET